MIHTKSYTRQTLVNQKWTSFEMNEQANKLIQSMHCFLEKNKIEMSSVCMIFHKLVLAKNNCLILFFFALIFHSSVSSVLTRDFSNFSE